MMIQQTIGTESAEKSWRWSDDENEERKSQKAPEQAILEQNY